MGYIYKITNLVNNKIYIGQTIQPIEKRWEQHIKSSYKKNNDSKKYAIHYAIQKYGKGNFSFTVIEQVENSLLNMREEYWIKELNTFIDNHCGYNMTYGGEGRKTTNSQIILDLWEQGYTITEISQKSGYSRSTCSIHLKNNGITCQELLQRREKYNSKKFSKTIYQYSLKGEFIQEWNSLAEVKHQLNFEQSLLSLCINGKVRTAYGYLWVDDKNLITQAIQNYNSLKYKKNRKVQQILLNDTIIKIWDSAELAGRSLNIDPSAIRRCCQNNPKYKTAKGFKWKYLEE